MRLELDEFDIHDLTYTIKHANKYDDYLQQRIRRVLIQIGEQINNQPKTKLCPLMKIPCITDGCVAWGPIEKLNRNGCRQLEK